jgi:hypothetical protein
MIKKEDIVSFNFIKKENFTGSMQGMRYRLSKQRNDSEDKLEVVIWPEPFAFTVTPEEQKQRIEFDFNQEGKNQAVDWLNEQYEKQKELWNRVNPYKS